MSNREYPVRCRLDTSDGGCLSVESKGDGDPCIIFVHGMGASVRTWDGVFDQAPPGLRLVRYDQRGHGASTAGDLGYGFARLVADLRELIAAVDGDKVLVGHSLGSAVVTACLAWEQVTSVTAAVLVSPVVAGPKGSAERMAANFAASSAADSLLRSRFGRRILVGALVGPDSDQPTRDLVTTEMLAARHRRELTDGIARVDLTGRLDDIGVPVRIVSGGADRAISPARARDIAARFPDAVLELLDRRGHSVPLEDPAAVLRQVDVLIGRNG